MAENYDVNCRVMEAKFGENGFEHVNKIGNIEIGELPEEQRLMVQDIIDDSKDIEEVRETLQKAGYEFSTIRQGETTRIFLKDKDLDQIRAINFEAKDEVERSEENVPELSAEERSELAKRIQSKKMTKEQAREQYGEKLEEREIDEEIDRNTLDFKEEVRLNQMLFEANDIYAVNDVLETYGLETVPMDRPYIIEHQSGYETGMKIVFGQETRVINEIATEEEKQAMLACNDLEQLDNVIKHTRIDRQDKRNMEMTNDEDERRNREGLEYSATGRNGWEYEGMDR